MAAILQFAPAGTYVMVKYDSSTNTKIIDWAKKNGIPNILPPNKLHTTVMQSYQSKIKNFEDLNDEVDGWAFKATHFQIAPTKLTTVGSDKTGGLMMFLEAPQLEELHDRCKKLGGVHSRTDYEPHMTISYSVHLGFDLDRLQTPTFQLNAKKIIAEPVDIDWIKR